MSRLIDGGGVWIDFAHKNSVNHASSAVAGAGCFLQTCLAVTGFIGVAVAGLIQLLHVDPVGVGWAGLGGAFQHDGGHQVYSAFPIRF